MPAHQLQELFIRIGLALLAGILIAIVPIALRKGRFEPRVPRRITCYAVATLALVGFFVYGWFLWDRYVPREPDVPPPLTYPTPPAGP